MSAYIGLAALLLGLLMCGVSCEEEEEEGPIVLTFDHQAHCEDACLVTCVTNTTWEGLSVRNRYTCHNLKSMEEYFNTPYQRTVKPAKKDSEIPWGVISFFGIIVAGFFLVWFCTPKINTPAAAPDHGADAPVVVVQPNDPRLQGLEDHYENIQVQEEGPNTPAQEQQARQLLGRVEETERDSLNDMEMTIMSSVLFPDNAINDEDEFPMESLDPSESDSQSDIVELSSRSYNPDDGIQQEEDF